MERGCARMQSAMKASTMLFGRNLQRYYWVITEILANKK